MKNKCMFEAVYDTLVPRGINIPSPLQFVLDVRGWLTGRDGASETAHDMDHDKMMDSSALHHIAAYICDRYRVHCVIRVFHLQYGLDPEVFDCPCTCEEKKVFIIDYSDFHWDSHRYKV